MFEKGILKAMENDHAANGHALEVKAVVNGHCHSKHPCYQKSLAPLTENDSH